ncbi:hypothetical protein SH611_22735 [Geminicoccaceae bacterium 1502E]|nr:hypothetical protein [Geminicoccaceae bacterium 1502E]
MRETIEAVDVASTNESWQAGRLVAGAGLESDRLATLSRLVTEHRIVPSRGEYFRLPLAWNVIVSHPIYPIPPCLSLACI